MVKISEEPDEQGNDLCFFKIVHPKLTSQHLRIPPKFTKHISKESYGRIILKGPSGRHWYAKLQRTSNGAYIKDGWQEFVRDHLLYNNELLIFRYDRRMCFSVLIFDKSGCTKELECHTEEQHQGPVGRNRRRGRPPNKNVDDISCLRKNRCHSGRTIRKECSVCSRQKPGKPSKEEVIISSYFTNTRGRTAKEEFIHQSDTSQRTRVKEEPISCSSEELEEQMTENFIKDYVCYSCKTRERPAMEEFVSCSRKKRGRSRRTAAREILARYSSKRRCKSPNTNADSTDISPSRACHGNPEQRISMEDDSLHIFQSPESRGCSPKGQSVTEEEHAKAAKLREAVESFSSKYPFVARLLNRSRDQYMPAEFAKVHLPKKHTMFIFRNRSGSAWNVQLRYANRRHIFVGGWIDFVRDNNLKEGDMCIFELVGEWEFCVHIYQLVNEAKICVS